MERSAAKIVATHSMAIVIIICFQHDIYSLKSGLFNALYHFRALCACRRVILIGDAEGPGYCIKVKTWDFEFHIIVFTCAAKVLATIGVLKLGIAQLGERCVRVMQRSGSIPIIPPFRVVQHRRLYRFYATRLPPDATTLGTSSGKKEEKLPHESRQSRHQFSQDCLQFAQLKSAG